MSHALTFVVPLYNAARWLPVTVPPMLRQTESIELVFVDDGSADTSHALLEALADEAPARHTVRIERHARNRGRSAARNTGVAASTAPLLAFVDADVAVRPDLAARLLQAHAATDAVAVHPRRVPVGLDRAEPFHRYLAYKEDRIGEGPPGAPLPWSRFVTAAVTLRRTAFDEAGGFDEAVRYGEDTELGLRVGRRHPDGLRLAPDIVVYHHDPDTLASGLDKFRRFAELDLPRLLARHPELRREVGASGALGRVARAAAPVVPSGAVRALLPALPDAAHAWAVRWLIFRALTRR